MKLLHLKDKRIVLARTEDRYVAFDDKCTHRGGSLAGGSTMCNVVQCPWHGSQFDLITGEVKIGPAKEGIKIYSVKEHQGKIILVL
jgi:nitrite reductase/ring-hydroxylating ferredoxin subunit